MYPNKIRYSQLIIPKLKPLSTSWYILLISMSFIIFSNCSYRYKCLTYKYKSSICSFVNSDPPPVTTTFAKQEFYQTKPFWYIYKNKFTTTLHGNSTITHKNQSDISIEITYNSILILSYPCNLCASLKKLFMYSKIDFIGIDYSDRGNPERISLSASSNPIQINKSASADLLKSLKSSSINSHLLYIVNRNFNSNFGKTVCRCLTIFQPTNGKIITRDKTTSLTQIIQVIHTYKSYSYPSIVILKPSDVRPYNV